MSEAKRLAESADAAGALDYPGRRKPLNRSGGGGAKETAVWDDKPTYYAIKGEKREFFTIRHLALALGRSQQSIRLWEKQGLLPRSGLRSPRTTRPVAAGKSTKGRRLWTREQIEAILRLAGRHGVILNKVPPTVLFARDVEREFKLLFDKEQQ